MQQSVNPHRHVLVRCSVINRDSATSVRFIEQDHFRLWQYMMANKHGLIVQDVAPCLWLPDSEYATNAAVFGRAGANEPVTCLIFAVYDSATGICNTMQRFVPTHETDQLREQLLQRVPVDLRVSDDFVMEQQRGYAVIKTGADISRLGLPLEP
jgi:hypothetical protein